MVKTPPKAKRSGDAITPIAKKTLAKRAAEPDQRGAIVEILMTHDKLADYRDALTSYLPPHGRPLSESDLRGVRAILDSDLNTNGAWAAFRGFFDTETRRK